MREILVCSSCNSHLRVKTLKSFLDDQISSRFMNRPFLAKIVRKIRFLGASALVNLSQARWRLKQSGISSRAVVDKTCRIEKHSGCNLQIHAGCKIHSGVQVQLKQGGFIELQSQVIVRQNCHVEAWGGALRMGRNSGLNLGCYVVAMEEITIGENVMIGPYVVIVDHDHGTENSGVPMVLQKMKTAPVTIRDDVWIGAHVTIAKGVQIGRGAIVGANAVVTHDVPEYCIAAGVPAKVIGLRQPPRQTDPAV